MRISKTLLLVAVLVLAASCETFTRRVGGDPVNSFRIVCSEGNGMWTVVTGKAKSLLIVGDSDIEIDELDFGEDNCEVKLNKD